MVHKNSLIVILSYIPESFHISSSDDSQIVQRKTVDELTFESLIIANLAVKFTESCRGFFFPLEMCMVEID